MLCNATKADSPGHKKQINVTVTRTNHKQVKQINKAENQSVVLQVFPFTVKSSRSLIR